VPPKSGLDHFEGWVMRDDIGPIRKEVLGPVRERLAPPTMRLIDIGLAFDLSARPA
jgi:hypothetical protein